MGHLGRDTEVTGGGGRFSADLSDDWEIWGPQGGYVATVALRAAAAHSNLPRPASFYCQYLSVAHFGSIDIVVTTLRKTRRAEALRVAITQQDKEVMEALIWLVDELKGAEHKISPPDVARAPELKNWAEHFPESAEPPFSFWHNVEGRPIDFDRSLEETVQPPLTRSWMKFLPDATFDDPFVDAGRLLIALDVSMFGAAVRPYEGSFPFIAPSMDLAVTFHQLDPSSEWLLVEATSPVAQSGLIGGKGSVWSESGILLATAIQQMLQKN